MFPETTIFFYALQYGARDKFLSGVVGGRTASESVANVASAAGESLAKAKRFVTDSPQKLELSAASPILSGDVINKSLSGIKDKTMTRNTSLLYEGIRW